MGKAELELKKRIVVLTLKIEALGRKNEEYEKRLRTLERILAKTKKLGEK